MEFQIIEKQIHGIQLTLSVEQARAVLVDPSEFQSELRQALIPLGAAAARARRGSSKDIALGPTDGNGNGHRPKVYARTKPGKAGKRSKGGYKMHLKKCELCGMLRHPRTSTCPNNKARSDTSPSAGAE